MDFQTRQDVCEYMAGLVPSDACSILEPTPGIGNLVMALEQRGFTVDAPDDFWSIDTTEKYDCVVMNPPFSPMLVGYKILYRCMDITDSIVALMPWLTLINSQKRTGDIKDYGLISVTHLPRNVFPGARVQTAILQMHRGYNGKTTLQFYV